MRGPGSNVLIQGDCIEVMRSWPDSCIDHCIADPPFGISSGRGRRAGSGLGWAFSSHVTIKESWDSFTEDEFFAFNVEWLQEVIRVVKPNGNIIVFGTYHNIYQLGFILQSVFNRRILNSIVWYKPNAQPNITARTLTESTEHIIWAVNGTPADAENWTFNYWDAKQLNDDKQLRNVWFESSDFWIAPVVSSSERRYGKHPSQKPLEVTDKLVAIASKPEDLILDPFVGTGAVGVSSVRYRRRYVLIEHDKKYLEITRQRIEDEEARFGSQLREEKLMSLTDAERRLLQDIPVPQADNLELVFDVAGYVDDGHTSRTAISECLEYARRQGPYYADAAMALGLIEDDRNMGKVGRVLSVTPVGLRYISLSNETERVAFRREVVLNAPIIKYVASQLGITQNGEQVPFPPSATLLDEDAVARALSTLGPGGRTIPRRAKTIVSWLGKI